MNDQPSAQDPNESDRDPPQGKRRSKRPSPSNAKRSASHPRNAKRSGPDGVPSQLSGNPSATPQRPASQPPTPRASTPQSASRQPIPIQNAKQPPTTPQPTAQAQPAKRRPIPLQPSASSSPTASNQPAQSKRAPSNRPIPLESGKRQAAPDDSNEEDDRTQVVDVVRRGLPSWLTSLLFHLLLILILAFLYLPAQSTQSLDISAEYAEELGEQLETFTFDMADMVELTEEDLEFIEEAEPVEDPFATMPELVTDLVSPAAVSQLHSAVIGNALDGRTEGMKESLLAEYGGTESTEEAVRLGLLWLQRNQKRNGLWGLTGPFSDGTTIENQSAATAMALLAFQGAGHTHERGEFANVVKRGWDALLARQSRDGDFYQRDGTQTFIASHHLYTHAQATIALCELYAMTRDETLREPAIKAVEFAIAAQSSEGGWRYEVGRDADVSVTGWFVMALQSAEMAGLDVDPEVMGRVEEFLRTCIAEDGIRYVYKKGHKPSPTMTAEALLCREYLGWSQDDERLINGARHLLLNPIKWEEMNVYYWYYATQTLHHLEGDYWKEWNEVMRQVIPENQVKTGREAGSWDPTGDPYGTSGGRLFVTCFCLYDLEVYYRHLPIYRFQVQQ